MHNAGVVVSGLLLLAEEEPKALIPAAVDLLHSILGAASSIGIVIQRGLFIHILGYANQSALFNFLSLGIELAQGAQVINQLVTQLNSFLSLFESVLVAMDLREYGAVLHFELAKHLELPHPVGDAPFFEVELVSTEVL